MSKPISQGKMNYDMIAEELSGDLTLDDLDPRAVKLAMDWAKKNHKRWPPKPITTGWIVRISSL